MVIARTRPRWGSLRWSLTLMCRHGIEMRLRVGSGDIDRCGQLAYTFTGPLFLAETYKRWHPRPPGKKPRWAITPADLGFRAQTLAPSSFGAEGQAMGRKTKLTPETQQLIVEAIKAGCPRKEAAAYAGVRPRTLREWIQRGKKATRGKYRDLVDALDQARAESQLYALTQIRKIAAKRETWQAWAWLLERRFPEHYGRRSDGQPREPEEDRERPVVGFKLPEGFDPDAGRVDDQPGSTGIPEEPDGGDAVSPLPADEGNGAGDDGAGSIGY